MKSPCENCEKQGCGKDHDTCQPYLKWKEWRKGIAEKRKADSETGGIPSAKTRNLSLPAAMPDLILR